MIIIFTIIIIVVNILLYYPFYSVVYINYDYFIFTIKNIQLLLLIMLLR
jgi:hypothetical protein